MKSLSWRSSTPGEGGGRAAGEGGAWAGAWQGYIAVQRKSQLHGAAGGEPELECFEVRGRTCRACGAAAAAERLTEPHPRPLKRSGRLLAALATEVLEAWKKVENSVLSMAAVGLAVDAEAAADAQSACATASALLDALFPAVLAALRAGHDEVAAAVVPFLLSFVGRLRALQKRAGPDGVLPPGQAAHVPAILEALAACARFPQDSAAYEVAAASATERWVEPGGSQGCACRQGSRCVVRACRRLPVAAWLPSARLHAPHRCLASPCHLPAAAAWPPRRRRVPWPTAGKTCSRCSATPPTWHAQKPTALSAACWARRCLAGEEAALPGRCARASRGGRPGQAGQLWCTLLPHACVVLVTAPWQFAMHHQKDTFLSPNPPPSLPPSFVVGRMWRCR